MSTMMKRIISLVLCFVLAVGYLPVGAIAAENGTPVATEATEVTTEPTQAASEETEAPSESTEVTEPEVIAVTGITLDKAAVEVGVGELPMTLTATVLPEDATDKTVTWTSSEPGVVSVENGVLAFGYMGTATVTAIAGEFSAECVVTVGEGESASYDLEGVVDAAIFFSDLHAGKPNGGSYTSKDSILKGVLNVAAATGLPFSSVTSVGDLFAVNNGSSDNTALTEAQADKDMYTGYIQEVLGSSVSANYTWSDHDRTSDIPNVTGLIYGDGGTADTVADDANYYIYAISMSDMTSSTRYGVASTFATSKLQDFTDTMARLDPSKPVFIASHQPLHAKRSDNQYAYQWFEVINAAAKNQDILFFWGHNHNYDEPSFYYYGVGDDMTIQNGSSTKSVQDINFSYICTGYLDPTTSNSATRTGTILVVTILEDEITVVTYNSKGVYTGSNALNETVEREHTTPAVTLTSITVEGQTEYTVGDAFVAPTVKAVYSDNSTKDITAECTFSGYDMTTASTQTVTVTWGEVATTYQITVKAFEIPTDYALARIEVVNQGNTKYFLNDALDTANLSVVAVYTKEEAADIRMPLTLQTAENEDGFTVSGFDMTKAGKQYVTVTYGECTGSFAIEVYETHFENETGTVAVDFGNYGITSVTITEAPKEVEGYSAYVTYDITPIGYTQGDEAIVTIALDTALFDETRPVKVLDQGNVIATPDIVDGKITFTATHFSEYDVAQVDAGDAEVDPSEWIEVIPATGGTTTYTYTRVNSITAGGEYVIVANNAGYALDYTVTESFMGSSVSMTSDTVNVSSDGATMTSTSELTQWKFSGTNGSITISNGNYTLGYSNGMGVGSNRTAYVQASDSNNFIIKRRINNTGYALYCNNGSWATSYSSTAQYVRLYQLTGSSTVGGTNATYGQIVGNTSYQVSLGTSEAAALQAVKNGMTVYYTTDPDSTTGTFFDDDGTGMSWTFEDAYNSGVAGTYTVTIKYNDVVLGTATVEVLARTAQSVELSKYEGQVERDSGAATETGAYLTVLWEGETEPELIPVTVGMLSGNSNLNVNKNGTYTGLSFSYGGETFENFTLKVVNKTGVDDFPLYPNPGSIDLKKSATGVDFQNTGIARVELSTSGLPANIGVDVVVVLDTGSSMSGSRLTAAKSALSSMLNTFMDATQNDGADIDVAVVGFNGFNGTDFQQIPNASLNNSYRKTADSSKIYTSANGAVNTAVFTNGQHNLDASDFLNSSKLTTQMISTMSNYISAGSGTNYDVAFASAYRLLAAKKAANTSERQQFVVFMSDGAGFLYNGFMSSNSENDGTSDGRDTFDRWLTGEWESVVDLQNAIDNPDWSIRDNSAAVRNAIKQQAVFYNGNGTNHPHRIAEAIKGAEGQKYTVVGSGFGADNNYMAQWDGLGAKIYSIGLEMANDTNDGTVTKETLMEVIEVLSSGAGYHFADASEETLVDAFEKIASEIKLAATNARFVDQMGDSFNLQMNPTIKTNAQGSGGTTTTTTDITITTRPVYTKDQLNTVVNGHTVTQDDIGKPYGNGTPVETVSFHVANDGSITATTTAGGYTLPDGTAVTANSTNILVDGVIYAKNFFYNNNNAAVTVTLANGSSYSLPGETFYWNIGTINETQYTISYTVYLEGALDGVTPPADSYATNNFAILYYTNHEGNEVSKSVASPTIAWEGANVSYAFYLVNGDGEPVHADGTVAQNFLQAHKITQPVVYQSVKLNDNEGTTLSAKALAVLPAGYELYAQNATYTVVIGSGDAQGSTTSHWTITGDDDRTTYVVGYGGANDYTNTQSVNDASYDYTHTTVYFAVKWVIGAVQDTVVIDYGLSVDINVMANDMFGNDGTLRAVGPGEKKPDTYGSALASGFDTSAEGDFGSAIIKDGKIRYTLSDMQIKGAEKLAYAVDYEGETNSGFYYGDLTIIPATTVYYEDEYVTLKTYTRPDTETAYTEKAGWPTDSVAASGTQAEDRPGSFNLGIIDANNIYGYDQAYEQMSTHSMGNSAMIHVDAKQYGTAEFTFWGTGFDVISTTSNETGTMVVQIYNANNELVTSKAVDTYYGYVYGLYSVTYQKNTDGIWEMVGVGDAAPADAKSQTKEEITSGTPNTDGTVTGYHYTWKAVNNNPNALYQVPVIKHSGLTYGQYTVKITALYYSALDATTEAGYDLYLDAIRIYDPAGTGDEKVSTNNGKDTTIADIYAQDGEAWPSYHELRNLIIKAATFDSLGAEDEVKGIIFIDGDATLGEGSTVTGNAITDYTNFGPNNELYLAAGQAVAFNMNLGKTADHEGYVPVVRIGMKTVGGKAAVAELWNAVKNTDGTVSRYNAISDTVETATDMYYDITVLNGRTVVIKNSGDEGSVLSITNIKLTYKPTVTSTAGINEAAAISEVEEQAPMMFSISRSAANVALMSLAPIDEEVPDAIEPTEPETEPTEPETEATEPEVTEPAKPNKPEPSKPGKPGKPGQEAASDFTELKAAVEEARKLKEKDYTKKSFEAVKAALKDAEKVLKNKMATQSEIDKALAELIEAVDALEVNAPATKPSKPEKEEKPAKPSKPEKEEKPAESTKPDNSNKPAKDEKPAQGNAFVHPGVEETVNQIKDAVAWLLNKFF